MKKINESFVCVSCKKHVEPAARTCRNHCPYCFICLHVDGEMPGDRSADCHGVMRPTQYEIANGSIKIQFLCVICGKIHHNKAADDDEIGELDTKIRHWKATYEVQEAIRES